MIDELISRVFITRHAAHLAHWRTTSYAQHMALGDFYDAIVGKLDAIVEAHQGAFGLVSLDKIPGTKLPSDILSHLKDEVNWLDENRSEIADGIAAIENMIDDLAGVYLSTYYKLKNLK